MLSRFFRRRPVVASIVVGALVVTGSISAYAVTQVITHPPTESPVAVPPLATAVPTIKRGVSLADATGEAAPRELAGTPLVPAVASNPVNAITSFDPSKAQIVSRGANNIVFGTMNGVTTEELSVAPLNVQRLDGTWVPISTTVAPTDAGGFAVADHPLSPVFSPSAGSGPEYSVSTGGNSLSFSLQGATNVKASIPSAIDLLSGTATATESVAYDGVFPGENLDYGVTASGVNETVVLNTLPSKDQSTWAWTVHSPGLTLSKADDGGINFTDAKKVVELYIPTPTMTDSSGVTGVSEAPTVDVPTALAQQADGDWTITLAPDPAWLNDPARIYPVYIDPSPLEADQSNVHSYESDGTVVAGGDPRVGNSRSSGDTYWRSVVHYPYESLFGDGITGVDLAAAYSGGTSSYFAGSVRDATAYSYGGSGTRLSDFNISTSGDATDSGLYDEIRNWVNSQSSGNALMLRGTETAGTYSYKTINTALYIAYEAAPTVTQTSPANGAKAGEMAKLSTTHSNPSGDDLQYKYSISTHSDAVTSPAWNSGWFTSSPSVTVPRGVLAPATTYYWKSYVQDEYGAEDTSGIRSFTTNNPPVLPSGGVPLDPADPSTVPTLTPTLTGPADATDADGDPISYSMRITSGTDGISGQVAQSPALTVTGSGSTAAVSWQVPAGILEDGQTYTWIEDVNDTFDDTLTDVRTLTINSRVTDPGPSPTDSAGPVTVNLANGNVAASFTSPTVSTVGGPIGLNFNYNSQQASNAGLNASYYSAIPAGGGSPTFTFPGKTPLLTRTDSQINFAWATASPGDTVPADDFMVQWQGYLTPPVGDYIFGFVRDDGAKFCDGTNYSNCPTSLNQWNQSPGSDIQWGASTSDLNVTSSTAPTPFQVQYYDHTGGAQIQLWVKNATGPANAVIVPQSWFTKDQQTLPGGWGSSQVLGGASGNYTKAEVHESSITLTDSNGGKHTYKKRSTGGYKPPPGEDGTVALDGSKNVTFTDDGGTVYLFNESGQLTSTESPLDAKSSAAPVLGYAAGKNVAHVLTSISDPLSTSGGGSPTYAKQVQFAYSTSTMASVGLPGGSALACPATTGFVIPPDMICLIVYPVDSSGAHPTTSLLYTGNLTIASSVQLSRIIDPGNEVTDFSYAPATDGSQLLSTIRNSLANDWLAADTSRSATGPVTTNIAYDSSNRATSVTLPAPDGVTISARPAKTYTYGSGTTYVDVAGITAPTVAPSDGHDRTVTFDSGLRQLTDTSALGLTTSGVWSSNDLPLSSTDAAGRESTTIYDSLNRPTDSYGPAPSTCFDTTTRLPSGPCSVTPAHTSTSYDGGLVSLNETWFKNSGMAGTPTDFTLGTAGAGAGTGGTGESSGSLNRSWAAGTPPMTDMTGSAVDWSTRATGTITFPATGTYNLYTFSDGGTRIWVNDDLVLDNWTGSYRTHFLSAPSAATVVATAGTVMRIRVEYEHLNATSPTTATAAQFDLGWQTPGTAPPTSGAAMIPIPGSALSPDYSLATSSHTDDSVPSGFSSSQAPPMTTSTSYGSSPWFGEAASTSVDPSGLNLTSTATYEPQSTTGFKRQLTSIKPAGALTTNTNVYYGTTEATTAAICGVPSGTHQYGMLKTSTGPTPAVGSAIVTTYVYDTWGRIAGTKLSGDPGWTCNTYDARGRVSQTVVAATTSAPQQTITHWFTSDGTSTGDPLTSVDIDSDLSTSPTSGAIKTVTDLLGNVTSTTDVWGTTTTNAYEALTERLISTTSTPVHGTAVTESFDYDVDGKLAHEKLGGNTIAVPGYNTAGELTSVSYPTGTGDAGNGTSLSALTRDGAGATISTTWSYPGGTTVNDAVVRSQSGRILQNTLTDGSTVETSGYSYDAAGRLISATIPGHTLTYGFGTASCGADTAAGEDGNRTSFSDTHNGGTPTTVAYCYDNSDRLTSTTVTGAPSGANPLLASNLTSSTLQYDGDGNTTTLADETLAYDASGNNTTTTLSDGTIVKYQRDSTGEQVQRISTVSGTATTVRYSGQFILDGTGNELENDLTLPGGVTVAIPVAGPQSWSYADVHGDNIIQTDGTGARQGTRDTYDPFGNPIDPTSGNIGTNTADDAVANTTPGLSDHAWAGSSDKLYEHQGDIATIEMGARLYVPALGRFLQTDPIMGGNDNDYKYPGDPLNDSDLTGEARPNMAGGAASPAGGMAAEGEGSDSGPLQKWKGKSATSGEGRTSGERGPGDKTFNNAQQQLIDRANEARKRAKLNNNQGISYEEANDINAARLRMNATADNDADKLNGHGVEIHDNRPDGWAGQNYHIDVGPIKHIGPIYGIPW